MHRIKRDFTFRDLSLSDHGFIGIILPHISAERLRFYT